MQAAMDVRKPVAFRLALAENDVAVIIADQQARRGETLAEKEKAIRV